MGSKNGIRELKEHPFLRDVNWETLISDEAPFIPEGKDGDAMNFPNSKLETNYLNSIAEEEKEDDMVKQSSRMSIVTDNSQK